NNPIGLAAGFDKNAEIIPTIRAVGFGYTEVGSVTGEPCEGNPKPRLWRLPQSKSLVVFYGLKNRGCKAISKKLKGKKFKIPLGVSVAKTNDASTISVAAGIADYVKAFKSFVAIADYITINISCPNTFGGEPFTDAKKLDSLLKTVRKVKCKKPVFLKISPDLSHNQLKGIVKLALKYKITGLICANLTKNRKNKKIVEKVPEKGGLSGKVVEELSNRQIRQAYKLSKGRLVLIGCGGVFSAKDAYKKIKAGASLIQLITGMIYEGPQVISEINQGLAKLLKEDGFKNIKEAIAHDNRQ
ncbi:MAG: quinone-dependent dihydroorotate dehydrogenase, partial [Candidatus Nanoarchaeia archaeon]